MTLFYSRGVEHENRDGPGDISSKSLTNDRVVLDIRTSGWVYHPALVTFNLSLRPQFNWRSIEVSDRDDKDEKFDYLGYSVSTTWLNNKPYTIKLSSARDRRDSASSVAADVTTESSADSIRLLLKNSVLPTVLTYTDVKSITKGFFTTEYSRSGWELNSRTRTEDSTTTFRIADMVEERVIEGAGSGSDRLSASLVNTLTRESGLRLSNVVNYRDLATNELGRNDTLDLRSQLSLFHRDNLQSNYSIGYSRNDTQAYSSRSTNAQAGLRHFLYENLTTSVSVNANKSEFTDGAISSYGGGVSLIYNRRIPWGSLSLHAARSERIQDNQQVADFVQVRDESASFDGIATTVVLNNINVDLASIVVTDATGTTVFIEGIDYQVEIVGTTVVITRDPFAGIGDDATVLISYRYAADLPAKTGFARDSYGARLMLWDQKVEIFHHVDGLEERLIEGSLLRDLRFDKTSRTGAQLSLGWSVTRIDVEDRDSRTTPMKRQSLRQNFNFRPSAAVSITVGAQLSETELKDTGEIFETRGANAGMGWNIGRRGGRLRASAFYRESRNVEEKGVRASYQWRFGRWYPLFRYEYIDEYNGLAEEVRKREIIYFEVRRKFG